MIDSSFFFSIYIGGLILNDVADTAEDARDRPTRPIPSGQIKRRSAILAGAGACCAGVALTAVAGPVALAVAAAPSSTPVTPSPATT